ncbi:DNA binding [Striga asiatica]|uniref:DNA binding n=1 Tax=Striga asiatica TaxID=4170 RepID=A0A5A7QRJ8_STRAF|nr:DNA binding [Striga asiatica]
MRVLTAEIRNQDFAEVATAAALGGDEGGTTRRDGTPAKSLFLPPMLSTNVSSVGLHDTTYQSLEQASHSDEDSIDTIEWPGTRHNPVLAAHRDGCGGGCGIYEALFMPVQITYISWTHISWVAMPKSKLGGHLAALYKLQYR